MSKRPYWAIKKKVEKKEEKFEEKKELKMFHLNPQRGYFSRAPPPPLYDAPATLEDVGTWGNLGLVKNSRRRGLAESGIPSRTSS